MTRNLPRRDTLHLVAKRMAKVEPGDESIIAWAALTGYIQSLAHPDHSYTPKFNDLIKAIREATMLAQSTRPNSLRNLVKNPADYSKKNSASNPSQS